MDRSECNSTSNDLHLFTTRLHSGRAFVPLCWGAMAMKHPNLLQSVRTAFALSAAISSSLVASLVTSQAIAQDEDDVAQHVKSR